MNLLQLGLPLALGLAGMGAGIGLGRAIGGAMEAMGRQPEAMNQIRTNMIIGAAFIEAIAIYALVALFMFQGKL